MTHSKIPVCLIATYDNANGKEVLYMKKYWDFISIGVAHRKETMVMKEMEKMGLKNAHVNLFLNRMAIYAYTCDEF